MTNRKRAGEIMAVACPSCRAQIGERCVAVNYGRYTRPGITGVPFHQRRREMANSRRPDRTGP
jgi:hypothetical protein